MLIPTLIPALDNPLPSLPSVDWSQYRDPLARIRSIEFTNASPYFPRFSNCGCP